MEAVVDMEDTEAVAMEDTTDSDVKLDKIISYFSFLLICSKLFYRTQFQSYLFSSNTTIFMLLFLVKTQFHHCHFYEFFNCFYINFIRRKLSGLFDLRLSYFAHLINLLCNAKDYDK